MPLPVAVAALFGAGVTASVSPCVLPLVPGYLAVITDGAGDAVHRRLSRIAMFAAGVLGTFVALGVSFGAAGAALTGRRLQVGIGAALIVLGAMMLFGAPGQLHLGGRLVERLPAQPLLRAGLLGVGCGVAWTPCVGPLLGAALTAAAGAGSPWRAAMLLIAYGCGVLLPFMAAGALRVPSRARLIRRAGRWAPRVAATIVVLVGTLELTGVYESVIQRLPMGT